MKGDAKRRHEKPAMVIAVIALVIALTGTAYAALSINSVGSRQIKAKAVTSAKFASNSVDGTKVADHSLTGEDFNMAEFGRAPKAVESTNAAATGGLVDTGTGEGHPAACPANTKLIHGICFDATSSGPIAEVTAAADACAAKGGYLPTTEELAATRSTLNLGDGTGSHNMYTDSYIAEPVGKKRYSTMVVNRSGTEVVLAKEDPETHEPAASEEYICVYPLIR